MPKSVANFSRLTISASLHPKNLHHFIAQMVDDLHSDSATLGFIEGAGGVAVQCFPHVFVDVGFEGGFQSFVRIIGTKKVGMPSIFCVSKN